MKYLQEKPCCRLKQRSSFWTISLLLVITFWLPTSAQACVQESDEAQAKIHQLIEQLGSEKFSQREAARSELKKLGFAAFDQIFGAQQHEDLEVRLSAKQLLAAIEIPWVDDTFSEEAQIVMHNFSAQLNDEKRTRTFRLKSLPPREAVMLLVRVARYDMDEKTSKRAALMLMQLKAEGIPPAEIGMLIQGMVKSSPRTAAQWLAAYADMLQDNDDLAARDRMNDYVTSEIEQLRTFRNKTETDSAIAQDLMRWQAFHELQMGRKESAFAIFRDLLTLSEGDSDELEKTAFWLLEHQGWELIVEMHKRYPITFASTPSLMYYLAQAELKSGHEELAQQYADQALTSSPKDGRSHLFVAMNLQERGLKKWAESEYRKSIELTPVIDVIHFSACSMLSEMLFDTGRAQHAADVLAELAALIKSDREARLRIESDFNRDPNALISRFHYFSAQSLLGKGDIEKSKQQLEEGISHEPTDADILIAMYRLPDQDEAWQDRTVQQINVAAGKFRDDIKFWQQELVENNNDAAQTEAKRQLAMANNQFAWLVCNTVGDYEEAIRCSHRSLELRPETGSYLDTLGHCYYAVDDFVNAVKYQKQAVELEPYEEIIGRKYKVFQRALAAGAKVDE
jgi:tetratricopeptide (TPR) repeat protein